MKKSFPDPQVVLATADDRERELTDALDMLRQMDENLQEIKRRVACALDVIKALKATRRKK